MGDNRVGTVISFFRSELNGLYESEEISLFIYYCFEAFLGFKSKAELVLRTAETMTESELLKFNFAISDLKKHMPIQYILGTTEFYGLPFKVNEAVLIPRPETEELVDLIIRQNQGQALRILDIGTGSGCIPVSLKKNLTLAELTSLDISISAIALANENAEMNGVQVKFILWDILDDSHVWQGGTFDLVVSNPPYIRYSERHAMEANVIQYEPHLALFVQDSEALKFYRQIIHFSRLNLRPGGKLYFEINEAFGREVVALLHAASYTEVVLHTDINGRDRMVSALKASLFN